MLCHSSFWAHCPSLLKHKKIIHFSKDSSQKGMFPVFTTFFLQHIILRNKAVFEYLSNFQNRKKPLTFPGLSHQEELFAIFSMTYMQE
jgi:hypothetical protein